VFVLKLLNLHISLTFASELKLLNLLTVHYLVQHADIVELSTPGVKLYKKYSPLTRKAMMEQTLLDSVSDATKTVTTNTALCAYRMHSHYKNNNYNAISCFYGYSVRCPKYLS